MTRKTPTLGLLADRQAARWEARRGSGRQRRREPSVAISRLPSSAGAEVGRRVAELLDYGLFGREIVDQIAHERGVGEWLVAGLDERVRSSIERYISDAFSTRPFTEDDYLKQVVRTIATLGRRGMSVILGRGAPFILSADEALRVLVVAPMSVRIDRFAKARDLTRERAAERLAQDDEVRRQFLLHQFGVRQNDPVLYDLVVNTGTMSTDDAAHLITAALHHRFPAEKKGAP